MRIIAGTHRGRRLVGPVDATTTRPITDRVKESLFNRLAARDVIAGARVADVFAGTGSMGIECLSRGAERVCFVERDREAVRRLRENLDTLRETDSAMVMTMDALGAAAADVIAGQRCSLIFVDPPYAMMKQHDGAKRVYRQIERFGEAAPEGAIVVLRMETHEAAEAVTGWDGPTSHAYGSMTLHFYERAAGGEASG